MNDWIEEANVNIRDRSEIYVIDLIQADGPIFFNFLLDTIPIKGNELIDEYNEKIKYVYKECLTQIVSLISNNVNNDLSNLYKYPELDYFQHIPEITNNLDPFINKFREFATSILVGININKIINESNEHITCILHGCTSTYMVIDKQYLT
jgi:hypothetical protein